MKGEMIRELTVAALLFAALAGCESESVWSVQQEYREHLDSVLTERETLMQIVADNGDAIAGYIKGEDLLGNGFSRDSVVADQLEACRAQVLALPDVWGEMDGLLRALDQGNIGVKEFKAEMATREDQRIAANDCWHDMWVNEKFAAWRERHADLQERCGLGMELFKEARARHVDLVARQEALDRRLWRLHERMEDLGPVVLGVLPEYHALDNEWSRERLALELERQAAMEEYEFALAWLNNKACPEVSIGDAGRN